MTRNFTSSPLEFYKVGLTQKENFMRMAVFREEDALRGGSIENCTTAWFINPMVATTVHLKLRTINEYRSCIGLQDRICFENDDKESINSVDDGSCNYYTDKNLDFAPKFKKLN